MAKHMMLQLEKHQVSVCEIMLVICKKSSIKEKEKRTSSDVCTLFVNFVCNE